MTKIEHFYEYNYQIGGGGKGKGFCFFFDEITLAMSETYVIKCNSFVPILRMTHTEIKNILK